MTALADLALSAEQEFHEEAVAYRALWREAARQPCQDALDEALGAWDVPVEVAERTAALHATWRWLTKSRDLSGAPCSSKSDLKPLRDAHDALASLAPTTTEERWAAEEAKRQELHEQLQRERSCQRVALRT